MKILIICNCTTGLERFRGMLIEKLIEQKNRVSVIVPVSDEEKELAAEKRIEKMSCKLIRISMERRGMNPVRDFSLFHHYIYDKTEYLWWICQPDIKSSLCS